jgi:protein-tyrosine phosphatase
MTADRSIRVLTICTGNICRSPLAECVLRHKAVQRGVKHHLHIDSAGIGDWHTGESPDTRACAVAQRHGVSMTGTARMLTSSDLAHFDLLVCMDHSHKAHALAMGADPSKVRLLRTFDPDARTDDVPDPYYGGAEGFEGVFQMIDSACDHLLNYLVSREAAGR